MYIEEVMMKELNELIELTIDSTILVIDKVIHEYTTKKAYDETKKKLDVYHFTKNLVTRMKQAYQKGFRDGTKQI